MLSLKMFKQALSAIQGQDQINHEFSKALDMVGDGYYVFGVRNKYREALMDVLREICHDDYDYISWFLDEDGEHKVSSEDREWTLDTPDALYDFLVETFQERNVEKFKKCCESKIGLINWFTVPDPEPLPYACIYNEYGTAIFRYQNRMLMFPIPHTIRRFVEVKEWDSGYLVVMAECRHRKEPVEEYIDIRHLLDTAGVDTNAFLSGISEVKPDYRYQTAERINVVSKSKGE